MATSTLQLEYRCKRCGMVFFPVRLGCKPDPDSVTMMRQRVFRLLMDGSRGDEMDPETGLCFRTHSHTIHYCGGGGYGVGEFIGVMVIGEGRRIEADTVPG